NDTDPPLRELTLRYGAKPRGNGAGWPAAGHCEETPGIQRRTGPVIRRTAHQHAVVCERQADQALALGKPEGTSSRVCSYLLFLTAVKRQAYSQLSGLG